MGMPAEASPTQRIPPSPPEPSAFLQSEGVTSEVVTDSSNGHERPQWGQGIQFLLTSISVAVGLGNIWRFPSLVYENGGGTFLIPYFTCALLVGFPVLYLELSLGQFARCGASVVYGRIKPAFHGIGWAMAMNCFFVGVYYNIVVAWTLIYVVLIIAQQSHMWMTCRNDFNTVYCQSLQEDRKCAEILKEPAFYFNRQCFAENDLTGQGLRNATLSIKSPVSPTEEFFDHYILQRSPTAEDLTMNWMVCGAYFVVFTVSAFAMYKGPKIIGKLSYFVAVAPYIIIGILFVRAVTLDGRDIGIRYYLLDFKPDVLYKKETWIAAATQVCYSLTTGFGGVLSFASYNKPDHNIYRDAFIITVADSFMSVFGGTAVFCVLGFMSKSLNVEIDKVVQDGTALAFVAYPEALAWLPRPAIWSFLFFFMLFVLGLSSEFGLIEAVVTAWSDQIPFLNRHKGWSTFGMCYIMFACGLTMCTRSGFYYFNLVNEYAAGFSITTCLIFETFLIAYFYGLKKYIKDLRWMFGTPKHVLAKVFGSTGYYVQFIWLIVSPLTWTALTAVIVYKQFSSTRIPGVGKDERFYAFPSWMTSIGLVISLIPFSTIPLFIVINVVKFQRQGKGLRELWRPQPEWPTHSKQSIEMDIEKLRIRPELSTESDESSKESK
ncbi:unnamed protein product [Bursaphelenchus xylophilus]|nr:unnamed protein product [Bursaphelenchus xylophilus]CAG9087029.1 unnamed protein product [Bursaphelenchus xylophilus]